jgi:hypothetical protein
MDWKVSTRPFDWCHKIGRASGVPCATFYCVISAQKCQVTSSASSRQQLPWHSSIGTLLLSPSEHPFLLKLHLTLNHEPNNHPTKFLCNPIAGRGPVALLAALPIFFSFTCLSTCTSLRRKLAVRGETMSLVNGPFLHCLWWWIHVKNPLPSLVCRLK